MKKYKVIDCQCDSYFWEGHKFKSKEEIVDALASYHDVDFLEAFEDDDEQAPNDIYDFLDKFLTTQLKLDFLLDHGTWEIEEVEYEKV
jgi:hypothetical protein